MNKNIFEHQHVRLAAVNPEKDAADEAAWTYDLGFARALRSEPLRPMIAAEIKSLIESAEKAQVDATSSVHFSVRTLEDDRLVGFARFGRVFWSNREGKLLIAIGDPEAKGKVEGEVIELMLVYAFDQLNLERVRFEINGNKSQMIAFAEAAGFNREACLREMVFDQGRYHDRLIYAVSDSEWRQRHGEKNNGKH